MAEMVGVAPAARRHPAVDLLLELGIAPNDGGDVGGRKIRRAEVNMQPASAINPRARLMQGIEGDLRLLQPGISRQHRADHLEAVRHRGVRGDLPVRAIVVVIALDLTVETGIAEGGAGLRKADAEAFDLNPESPIRRHRRPRS
jgi:hypothetical protein